MQVAQVFMHNALRNFNYIIYSDKSKDAIFVDPLDVDRTLKIAKQLKLNAKYLINTHQHHDHIHDNEKFLKLTGATHIKLQHGEKFKLSEVEVLEAIDTPGHVMNHQCFLLVDNNIPTGLITGDALFNAGVGNCKNGGDVNVHFNTIFNIVRNLPEQVKIYPSHDYLLNNLEFALTIEPKNESIKNLIEKRKKQDLDNQFIQTDLGLEKKINPFLRLNAKTIVEKFSDLNTEKERFIAIRKLRDNW